MQDETGRILTEQEFESLLQEELHRIRGGPPPTGPRIEGKFQLSSAQFLRLDEVIRQVIVAGQKGQLANHGGAGGHGGSNGAGGGGGGGGGYGGGAGGAGGSVIQINQAAADKEVKGKSNEITVAKITAIGAIIVALIGALGTIAVALFK